MLACHIDRRVGKRELSVPARHREVRGLGHCPAGGAVREDRQRIDRPAGEMAGAFPRCLQRAVLRDQAGSLDEGFVPELYDASVPDAERPVRMAANSQ